MLQYSIAKAKILCLLLYLYFICLFEKKSKGAHISRVNIVNIIAVPEKLLPIKDDLYKRYKTQLNLKWKMENEGGTSIQEFRKC